MPIEWLSNPPASTIFILFISFVMTLASSLINRLLVSKEQRESLVALRRDISELTKKKNENQRKAKRTGDKKLLKKVRKQEREILQLQSKMASASLSQMKAWPITMVMFLLVWTVLTGRLLYWSIWTGLFRGEEILAYLPWITGELPLNLFLWYFLCSLFFGTILSRLLGLMGEME